MPAFGYRTTGFAFQKQAPGVPRNLVKKVNGTRTPVGGDLVFPDSSDTAGYTADTSTVLYGIASGEYSELQVYGNPGVTVVAGKPNVAQFGGRGMRDDDTATKRVFVQRITADVMFTMDVKDAATTPAIGTSYGITRISAGKYALDAGNTTNLCVKVVTPYEADVLRGQALAYDTNNSHAAVWVSPVTGSGSTW